jgi:hypothetical protein
MFLSQTLTDNGGRKPMAERNFRKRGLMLRYDICEKTVDRRRESGLIPPPDFYVGPYPYWTGTTLDKHDRKAPKKSTREYRLRKND